MTFEVGEKVSYERDGQRREGEVHRYLGEVGLYQVLVTRVGSWGVYAFVAGDHLEVVA